MTAPKHAYDEPGIGRFYFDGLPSVTNVIEHVVATPAIAFWHAKIVGEYAVYRRDEWLPLADTSPEIAVQRLKQVPRKIAKEAAALGTIVHEAAHAAVTSRALPKIPPAVQPFVDSWNKFCDDLQPCFLVAEATVSSDHGYAGSFDAIVRIDGLGDVLIDYKTAIDTYVEAALQLSAYRHANQLLDPDHDTWRNMMPVDAAAVLHLREDGYSLLRVDAGPETFEAFKAAVKLFNWLIGPKGINGYQNRGFDAVASVVAGQPIDPFDGLDGTPPKAVFTERARWNPYNWYPQAERLKAATPHVSRTPKKFTACWHCGAEMIGVGSMLCPPCRRATVEVDA